MPVLHSLLHPVKETIGVRLLRSMGWKPNQGVGERMTKKAKKERRTKYENTKVFGCSLPPTSSKQMTSDGDDSDGSDSDQLYAPDDVPAFLVKPKTNKFGLGYSGLLPQSTSNSTTKSGFVLFEPTLKLTDRKKKLQIAGQAFGVGAFENEDEDIYSKDDMSQYDFELGGDRNKQKKTQMLALPGSDVLEGFVRATAAKPAIANRYPPPVVPKDFVPIHRSEHSRFDIKPQTEAQIKGLGRHDLNAHQRAAILNEVLDLPPETADPVAKEPPPVPLTPAEVVAQALVQIRKNIAAQQEKLTPPGTEDKSKPSTLKIDPEKAVKVAKLKEFVDSSRTVSTFQPFARDADKQYRFEAFCILSKHNRLEEFRILQPDGMTAWECEREEVKKFVFNLLNFNVK